MIYNDKVFLNDALQNGIRLDGRGYLDYRDVELILSRTETSSIAEVCIGSSRVLSTVYGDIIPPYPDRPSEGIINFNSDISLKAETFGLTTLEITRLLEKTIKESNAIDTESLCLISGDKVWRITCNISVLDYDGGNVIDAIVISTMAALRAFRKCEVTLNSQGFNVKTNTPITSIIIHSSDEREPLPLALHHTPLSVTIGIFKTSIESKSIVLIADPSNEEEIWMNGSLQFCINAHGEICVVNKKGNVGIKSSIIMKAANLASDRAKVLHNILQQALFKLDEATLKDRSIRIEKMKQYRMKQSQLQQDYNTNININSNIDNNNMLDDDDELLNFAKLHQRVSIKEN